MLLRVRSNLGTWKYTNVNPTTFLAALTQRILREGPGTDSDDPLENHTKYQMTQALSRNPGGSSPLPQSATLQDLGLKHGDMLHCRLQETSKGDQGNPRILDSATAIPGVAESRRNNNSGVAPPGVIDLVDSDNESDNPDDCKNPAHATDKNDDGDDSEVVEVPPPPPSMASSQKRTRTEAKASTSKNSHDSGLKKRPRMASTVASSNASASQTQRQQDDLPLTFQVASYNVWFGPPDPSAQQVYPQQRMEAIIETLQPYNDLLFVGFQELTSSLCEYLEPQLLRTRNMRFCRQPGIGNSYGVGLAISKRLPIVESKFLPFSDSIQGRGLLYVQTPTLLFGTCHLESFLNTEYDGATQREAQLQQAASFCESRLQSNPQLQMAVLLGDFNWDDERPTNSRSKQPLPNRKVTSVVSEGWKDAGTPLDYTYDGKENPMLSNSLRKRLDRCLYKTQSCQVQQFDKLGQSALPGLIWNKKNPYNGTIKPMPVAPSDHFGIAITFASRT